jgi:hypothetical protein
MTLRWSDAGAAPRVSQGWPARTGQGCGGATGRWRRGGANSSALSLGDWTRENERGGEWAGPTPKERPKRMGP